MKPVLLRWLACAGLIVALPIGAARGDTPEAQAAAPGAAAEGTAATTSASGQPSLPAAIPLAEISTRAEETAERLRVIVARLESSANLGEAEAGVAEDGRRLQTAADRTNAVLQLEPRLSVLDDLVHGWTEGRQSFSAITAKATAHASDCSAALDEIQKLSDLWTRTGESARAQGAPEQLIGRADATLEGLQRTHERILALRDRLLALQEESTRQLGVCDEMLARLEQSRHGEVEEIGSRNGGPIWRAPPEGYGRDALFRPILIESRNELWLTAAFLSRHGSFLPLQLVLFGFLAIFMRHARGRAEHWTDCGPEIHAHLVVLELPYSVALLLMGLCAYVLHPDAPRLLWDAEGTLLAVPVLRVLQRIVHPILMRPIYGIVVLRVVDRVQDFVAPSPLLEQILLCLAMGSGLVFMLWSVSSARTRGIQLTQREASWLRGVNWTARLLAVDFGIAFFAGAFGYINLARFLSSTLLVTVNAAVGFFVAARVLLGLWDLSLAVRPLAALRMVQGHRLPIARWSATLIVWLAVAGWLFTIRAALGMLGLRTDNLKRAAAVSVSFGSVTVSLGDLFFFGITLWGSVLLSRLIRFVLDEELFPRFRLAHGLSYALSNLIHYAILMMGLLLALATLGFDASRLTVMVGALGVGIGFGLQSIVNNFVSGLILLLERPIKTGDTVQVGQVTGEVKRIGVRSSTVRTPAGAEVIVPNSSLISDTVTNWTLSDRSRRFELPVGVAYGTKPARVLAMLTDVAKQHPEVLANPEPNALFLGFGESSLDFELHAWVGDGGRLAAVKSAVAVALSEAFDAAGIQIPFPQRDLHIVEPTKP
ncbi:MAG TPA: mechanosensitive ion channel domain-containing protein [Myxococcota bacterium]|nr:mechanosensitive ion channel domain-containing protein [Myxococcota bacterium]